MQRRFIWLIITFVTLLCGTVWSQNLVPNSSFETYRNCPRLDNLLQEAIPWYNPNRATPDFYHQCFQTGQMILPPHSGAGLARLFFDRGWGEYLGIRLLKPLEAGKCYYLEMYVATDTPNKYLTETLGLHLSTQPLTATATTEMFTVRPQVLDHLANIPSLKWQRVSGVVEANGNEQYLTIGSFFKTPPMLGFYYVFIDDVTVVPINLDLGKDTTLCSRRATLPLNATTPGATDYLWNDGSTNATLRVAKAGTYSVKVTTPCKILTDTIRITYALDFDLGADTTLCNGQTVTLTVPPEPKTTYRWQDGSVQNQLSVKQEGQYSVQVFQANCVATDTIQVRYIPPPALELGADQALCGAQTFVIRPTVTEGKFTWHDQFAETERTVNSSGVFWASVRNACATVTDSVVISYGACDCVLYAPSTFTPNGDGQNDTFLTYACGDITITSLTIFNRWGEAIFQTTAAPFQWDGTYHGESCSSEVYAWSIHYQQKLGKQIIPKQDQGQLLLLR
ncbi:gliding motility-associated C-terminal domain-containing protein [Spirosoma sp. BT702]|uniref:Gliding motility-associated C-terminal domain-containing protein n=1 Tax=Spirosoma profusum TaxID=2771354 RepID=A0A927GA45_9BACT|nr:T9SS type B sorting domain-containing protein [Spirosoma profusum]MBD2705262.1 gliding motility-associated C-terminal domain-containing protein [Spirosoma profusum]